VKKILLITLLIFTTLFLLAGCDSVNLSGSSSSTGGSDEYYSMLVEVVDEEDGEGLEQAALELEGQSGYGVQSSSDEGVYEVYDLDGSEESYTILVDRFNYESAEKAFIPEEDLSLLVELEMTDDEEQEDVIDDPNMIEVEVDENNSDLEINDTFHISQHPITNKQYVEFLNDMDDLDVRGEDGEQEVLFDNGSDTFKLIDLNQDFSQIGYNGEDFYLRGWSDPSGKSIDVSNYPVIEVTWYGAVAYTNWLSDQEDMDELYDLAEWELKDDADTMEGYRLPMDKEWEYAASGGNKPGDTDNNYAGEGELDEVAWYWGNSDEDGNTDLVDDKGTMPVGLKEENELELHDMSGLVREWTQTESDDNEGEFYYMNGSWGAPIEGDEDEEYFEVDYKFSDPPSHRRRHIGFRPVRTNSD